MNEKTGQREEKQICKQETQMKTVAKCRAIKNRGDVLNKDLKLEVNLRVSSASQFSDQILWPRKIKCYVQTSTTD